MKRLGTRDFAAGLVAAAASLVGCAHGAFVPSSQALSPASVTRASPPALQVLQVFRAAHRGWNPIAPVTADSAGDLFGETFQGGNASEGGGCGSIFELSPSGARYVETILHRFGTDRDGCSPSGGLVMDSSGAFYGTTAFGGTSGLGNGTVFKLTPDGSKFIYSVIYRFKNGRDGALPESPLVIGYGGVIYGATQYGAEFSCAKNTEGCGTIFSLVRNGSHYSEQILHSFSGGNDGLLPGSGLAANKYGDEFFGTTTAGGGTGSIGIGTVYAVTLTDSGPFERVIHAFKGGSDGSYPVAPVIVEHGGAVVGTTLYGGNGADGVVFRLTSTNSGTYKEHILYRFQGGPDGSQPAAPVIDNHGVFYGTTTDGATGFPCRKECGTIFELTQTTSGYANTVLYHFTDKSGWYPRAGVIDINGALYGTTYFEGRKRYAGGTVYKLTL